MLFSQTERLVWHDETISLINVGQLCGHSCLRIETSTKLSLFRNARWALRFSSELELSMMKLTMKFRMPIPSVSSGSSIMSTIPTLTLLPWQNLPLGHDNIIKDLQANI